MKTQQWRMKIMKRKNRIPENRQCVKCQKTVDTVSPGTKKKWYRAEGGWICHADYCKQWNARQEWNKKRDVGLGVGLD